MTPDAHAATLAADTGSGDARPVLGARYELLGMLGAGGMGNVYRARDLELDELVALKVLRPELVGAPGALDRFRREVKLARRVTHPNVARVFDIGEHGGDKILTMELIDGESLASLLEREGSLPLARAIEIGLAISAGVGAAHAAGVVHRDLKPDNVLLAKDGRVVVADFGIARAIAGGAQTQGFIGTPAYMAPEQIDEGKAVDHRADLYAFGAMLYELLTGQRPWRGESLWALAAARLLRPPPDPRETRADVPEPLAALVLRCMARDPAERYASMTDVADALALIAVPETSSPSPAARRDHAGLGGIASGTRVAVLPFRNLGPADQEYVADGLTEDLIDLLSVASGLRVRSRGVVMRFKGADRDPRDLGRELDVQVVVEGSVRRSGGAFRISARVVSVADGFQLWARRFEGPDAELLATNDVVARAVAEALTVGLATPQRDGAEDPGAIDLYLRARALYHEAFTAGFEHSVPLFEEAVARSPRDSRVIAGYAMALCRGWRAGPPSREKAKGAVARALELGPSLPDAHVAQGLAYFAHENDQVRAVSALRRALRLAPGHPEAHELLGRILGETDRDEGRQHLETAMALAPLMHFPRVSLARHHALRGEWERAFEVGELPTPHGTVPLLPPLARWCLWRRDATRATQLLVGLEPSSPPMRLAKVWLELAAHGKAPAESGLPPNFDEFVAPMRHLLIELEAEMAAFVGDGERAIAAILRAESGDLIDVAWLERCPLLDPIRDAPEIAEARARIAERAARVVAAYREPER